MPEIPLDKVKSIPREKLLEFIKILKRRVKKHKTVLEMFEEYDIDLDEIDLIPMAFAELDVSARTDHGAIYLAYKLLQDGSFLDDAHYLVHEMTHFLQQTTGDKPTQSSDVGDYLDNEFEQEGFQNQTEYIADTKGEDEAEEYIDQVLNHHDVDDEDEREEKKDELLNIARRRNGLLS